MNLRKYLLAAAVLAASICGFDASAWSSSEYHIDRMDIHREQGQLKIEMSIDPSRYHIGTDKQMVVVPVIRSIGSNDSVVLPAVIVAGRNSYYSTMRSGDTGGTLLRSGKGHPFEYTASARWQDWMEHSTLELQSRVTGCCGVPENEERRRPVATLDWRPATFTPAFHYTAPPAHEPKNRKIEGKAYVSFPVNRTEIYPDYMINPSELRKITSSIDTVRMNPDATVKTITLIGYASPEGPYRNNVRLAAGRTEAVKEYVRKLYTFPSGVFRTASVPEDWQGLRDSVAVSVLPDRDEILRFIDSGVPVERRNDELRSRFPSSYAFLLKHVYPWLRHTNYVIDYEIREYNDIAEILRVLKERPQNLSLNEFYLAAGTYPPGSPEYNNVMETALAYNKDSEVANLNAANAAMQEGAYKRARILLERVPSSPAAIYGLAVLDALEGNLDRAGQGFENAGAAGMAEAAEALVQLQAMKERRENVRYIMEEK